jgi:putative endonuclease
MQEKQIPRAYGARDDRLRLTYEKERRIRGDSVQDSVLRLKRIDGGPEAKEFADVRDAIAREKQIKGWVRSRKIKLIEQRNPRWEDLAAKWFQKRISPP